MGVFKIIDEVILDFGNKDQLYLMFIRHNERYFVEIDSRRTCVGRMRTRSYKESGTVYEHIYKRMSEYTDMRSALDVLNLAFSMPSVRQCMFVINVLNTKVEFNSIWKMKNIYGCETSPKNTDLIFENENYDNTIQITFPNSSVPLGWFKASDVDSKFTFFVNEHFLI